MLPDSARIHLDTPGFVYYLEANPRYQKSARDFFLRAERSRGTTFASVLVIAELLVPYHRSGRAERARELANTLHGNPGLEWVATSWDIAEDAARLGGKYNLHTPDAIHMSTALKHEADWFVTNDSRLKRVEDEGIRIWLFDEHTDLA